MEDPKLFRENSACAIKFRDLAFILVMKSHSVEGNNAKSIDIWATTDSNDSKILERVSRAMVEINIECYNESLQLPFTVKSTDTEGQHITELNWKRRWKTFIKDRFQFSDDAFAGALANTIVSNNRNISPRVAMKRFTNLSREDDAFYTSLLGENPREMYKNVYKECVLHREGSEGFLMGVFGSDLDLDLEKSYIEKGLEASKWKFE